MGDGYIRYRPQKGGSLPLFVTRGTHRERSRCDSQQKRHERIRKLQTKPATALPQPQKLKKLSILVQVYYNSADEISRGRAAEKGGEQPQDLPGGGDKHERVVKNEEPLKQNFILLHL